jgi:hypothetical protein
MNKKLKSGLKVISIGFVSAIVLTSLLFGYFGAIVYLAETSRFLGALCVIVFGAGVLGSLMAWSFYLTTKDR